MDKDYYIEEAKGGACFHGETWLRCPYCDYAFEYFQAAYGSAFHRTKENIYGKERDVYTCPECQRQILCLMW